MIYLKFYIPIILLCLFSACSEETIIEEETQSSEQGEIIQAPIEEENEVIIDEKIEPYELESKTYSAKEFFDIFLEHGIAIIGQTATIKGYYKNHNKQKASGQEDHQLNVTLYMDKNFESKDAQAFFIMGSNDDDLFKNVMQGDELTIQGVIQKGDFFGAPILHDGVIVK